MTNNETAFKLTRKGYLAVELMPCYHGKELENAVERIAQGKCRNQFERDARTKANFADFPDRQFPDWGGK